MHGRSGPVSDRLSGIEPGLEVIRHPYGKRFRLVEPECVNVLCHAVHALTDLHFQIFHETGLVANICMDNGFPDPVPKVGQGDQVGALHGKAGGM